ncbi:MAG: hypothetical protein R3F48_02515 [Candidatus Zixiibacteriota bacterium]
MEVNAVSGWLAVGIVILFFLIPIPIIFLRKRGHRKDNDDSGEFDSSMSK